MTKKAFILFCWLLSVGFAKAQNNFPAAWQGVWQGTLNIYGKVNKPMQVKMQLHILPADSGTWQWQIVYIPNDKPADVRKYKLLVNDSAKGHYTVDEQNSIAINGRLFGNAFITRFAVSGSLLLIKYEWVDGDIRFEVTSGDRENTTETGNQPQNGVPPVYVYSVGTYQTAMLKKIE